MRAPSGFITIDFETEAIRGCPSANPPKPVGVAIKPPGRAKGRYLAWGHPEGNNCSFEEAKAALSQAWYSGAPLLFHNAKFDTAVAEKHFRLDPLPWDRVHDTMFLLFLNNPHARSFALKPSAEELLGLPPEERDAVRDWLVDKKVVARNAKDWGAHISVAPGKLVGSYAVGDVERTAELFRLLYPAIHEADMIPAYNRERELMPILQDSERRGIRVDRDELARDLELYNHAMEQVEAWLRKRLKSPGLEFDKDEAVADALESAGIVTNWALTEKTQQRSLSKDNVTSDMFSDPRVWSALGYRNRLQTCLGTFMNNWLSFSAGDSRVHTEWNQVRNSGTKDTFAGTRTGRLSSARPNFMNLPKNWYDKGDGYEHPAFLKSLPELPNLRRYFLPEKKGVWVHRDYNQQELRILGHFEQGVLLDAYNNPKPPKEWCNKEGIFDVHQFVAVMIEEVTGRATERRETKILNFGMIYGMGAAALAEDLECSVQEAKTLRGAHKKALPGVGDLDRDIKALVKAALPIKTWGGRIYFCEPPSLNKKTGRMQTYEYKLLNYLIQGSAADCTKQALINYHNHPKRRGIFLATVHDEINSSAPASAAKAEHRIMRECMMDVNFSVPMLSNGKTGLNWGSLSKE